MGQRWLLKTEPSVYSFADLEREGRTIWDGVTNNLALKNLRTFKAGDRVFIYHTGDERQVVGIAKVVSDPYPDPRNPDGALTVVDVVPEHRLPRSVPLTDIKSRAELSGSSLVRLPRLSVVPLSPAEWAQIAEMGGLATK